MDSSKINQLGTLSKYHSLHLSWLWTSPSLAMLTPLVSANKYMINYEKQDAILLLYRTSTAI